MERLVMRVPSISLLALVALASRAAGQQPPAPPVDTVTVIAVRLSDGTEVTGRVVAADDSSITLLTFAGTRVTAPRRSIVSWRARKGKVTASGFQEADPNTSRLFFGPTARTLPQGRGYFADYYLFFPVAGGGVTNDFMVSGGFSIVPGSSEQIAYGAAKLRVVHQSDLSVAIGGLFGGVPGEGSAGFAYAVTTIGSEDNALTVMGGVPFSTDEVVDEPVFMVGGEARTGGASKFMAEAWKLPGAEEVPLLFGMRWFGHKVGVGFGLIYVLSGDVEGWPFIPWVDFSVNW
jgi:hypothetical protein